MNVDEPAGMNISFRRVVGALKRRRLVVGVALVAVVAVFAVVVTNRDDSSLSFDPVPPKGATEEESTELAPDDEEGSPHVVLPDDFDPSTNTERTVPDELRSDSDNALDVKSAKFIDGNGPYELEWKVARKSGDPVSCRNCAFVDERVKLIIKAVLESDIAESVEEIVGLDPTRTLAGDYSGNGWQVEFVVGSGASGYKNGEQIAEWLLKNSRDNKIYSILWRNLLYKEAGKCDAKLAETAPVEAYPQDVPERGDEAAARDAGMDRVVVASPAYEPKFEDRDGAQFVSAWKATGC